MLPLTNRLSRRAIIFAVMATDITDESTLTFHLPWVLPREDVHAAQSGTAASSFAQKKALHAFHQILSVMKIATSFYHLNNRGGVKRVNH